MPDLFKQSYLSNKTNLFVELSPEVVEQLSICSSEVKEAFKRQVVQPLLDGKSPGSMFNTSLISSKILYYVPLCTGEVVFYEATFSHSSGRIFCYSVHYMLPKHMVDEFDRRTVFSTVCKNINTFTAPFRHFLLANKIIIFLASFIGALFKFLFLLRNFVE